MSNDGMWYNYKSMPVNRIKRIKGRIHKIFKAKHGTTLGKLGIDVVLIPGNLRELRLMLKYKGNILLSEYVDIDDPNIVDGTLRVIEKSETFKKLRLIEFLDE